MRQWQKKVITERDDVLNKLIDLNCYLSDVVAPDDDEFNLLRKQRDAMKSYMQALNDRIDAFKEDPEERIAMQLWFKSNYLEMFLKKAWIIPCDINAITMDKDGRRFTCYAAIKRKNVFHLNTYCSTNCIPVDVEDVNVQGT